MVIRSMEVFRDSKYKGLGYKTKKQWQKEYKIIKSEKKAIRFYVNGYKQSTALYYPPDAVRDITERDVKKMYNRLIAFEDGKIARENNDLSVKAARITHELENLSRDFKNLQAKNERLENAICNMIKQIKPLEDETPSIICIDIETSGLESEYDEILQVSIIDDAGNTLLNEYIKPYYHTSWTDAEKIHGITPAFVEENGKYIHEILPILKNIMRNAKTIIGYNIDFDLGFLSNYVELNENVYIIDVMEKFAPIYGEWNEYYESYAFQKLATCAEYYGYEWEGAIHDSLQDAKATLHCWKKLNSKMNIIEE